MPHPRLVVVCLMAVLLCLQGIAAASLTTGMAPGGPGHASQADAGCASMAMMAGTDTLEMVPPHDAGATHGESAPTERHACGGCCTAPGPQAAALEPATSRAVDVFAAAPPARAHAFLTGGQDRPPRRASA